MLYIIVITYCLIARIRLCRRRFHQVRPDGDEGRAAGERRDRRRDGVPEVRERHRIRVHRQHRRGARRESMTIVRPGYRPKSGPPSPVLGPFAALPAAAFMNAHTPESVIIG